MPTKLDYFATYFPHKKTAPHASYYPIISNVRISVNGIVTWTTDVPSTSQAFYGVVPYLGFQTVEDTTYVTSHTVQLTGLTEGLLYYVRVQSFNIDSLSISDLYTFTVATNTYSAIILRSPNLNRWSIAVTTNGNLDTELSPIGPAGAYDIGSLTLQDSNGIYWTVTIQNTGDLVTTSGGSPISALSSILVLDSNDHIWTLTVSILGNLVTT